MNRNPVQTEEFKAHIKPKVFVDGLPLADRPLSVRFDVECDRVLRDMCDRQSFIREAVKLHIERMGNGEEV